MSFLSVLKAVGKGVLTIGGLVNNPVIKLGESLLPAAAQPYVSELNKIAGVVGQAEAIGEGLRAQLASVTVVGGVFSVADAKAKAVLPSVEEILKQASFLSGRKIADEARFTLGCQKILDGMVDVLDSVEHPNG